ncbi:MAG: hypothetical protein M0C28_41645 [Candidatus Moduliflexus flocculans]|nr:hypothetical protein [Candidatus Moduliflexus flocculans]
MIKFEARQGVKIGPDNLLVVSASQQALDIVAKVFIDPGDYIIARPSHLPGNHPGHPVLPGPGPGHPLQPVGRRVRHGRAGEALRRGRPGRQADQVHYTSSRTSRIPRGSAGAWKSAGPCSEFSYRTGLPLVEDSPYREIRFLGRDPSPSIFQLDQEGENRGNVLNLKTFSKILAPGHADGLVMANPDIISKFVVAKQAMDLCTNVFAQKWIAECLKTGKIYSVIERTCGIYRDKRNYMTELLEKHLPKRPDISWTKPEGGLFLWIRLPAGIDTDKMLLEGRGAGRSRTWAARPSTSTSRSTTPCGSTSPTAPWRRSRRESSAWPRWWPRRSGRFPDTRKGVLPRGRQSPASR